MPTLINPSARVKVPYPIAGVSTRGASTTDDKVLSTITPAASDGNSVFDHMSDVKAELGHRTDNDEFKGPYNPSTTYAIGDEVTWTDGSGKKRFYKRITAGDDGGSGNPSTHTDAWISIGANVHDLTIGDYGLSANSGLLERLQNGQIRFNRRAVEILQAALTEAAAEDMIQAGIKEVVQNNLWQGEWQAAAYVAGAFVKDNGDYFQARQAIGSTVTTPPASDTTNWTQLTPDGYHYDIAKRLEAITDLLAEQTFLIPTTANRGQWMSRRADSEGYAFENPPMQWKGDWHSGTSYFFGDTVNHDTRVWTLTAAATVHTAKRGSSTEPGTDAAWTQIIVGHTSDVPGWRGEWVNLAGSAIRIGDMVRHRGFYYIARNDLTTRGGTAPDLDETNWDLISIVLGNYASDTWWPEGGIVKYEGNWWYSTEQVENTDPAPGTQNDTKWLQIGGYATKDEFAQLRRDIADLGHGSRTSRGVLVDGLEEPPTATSAPEVWLPRKAVRAYTIDASLINGNTGRSANIGDEPGQYKLTSGTPNKARGVIGKFVDPDSSLIWYGILTRAEDGAVWPRDIGSWQHNPVGSAIIGCGVQQFGASSWRERLLIKKGIMVAVGGGSDPSMFLLEITKHDGTKVGVGMSGLANEVHFHDVTYEYWHNEGSVRGEFGDIYEAASNEAERTVEIAIILSASGSPRWLGNRQYDWTRQPPITSSDLIPVVSADFHQEILIARSAYRRLEALAPRTKYLIYEDA